MVFFTAVDMNKENTTAGGPVVFDDVKANEGGCFDVTTGKFTVKVPGSYVFIATAWGGTHKRAVSANITIDDDSYTKLHGSYTSTGSCSVVVKLAAGQSVWMEANSPPGNYWPSETSFSGTLIKPLL